MKIIIQADPVKMEAELVESDTARQIYDALPLEAEVQTWGDEIYFEVPVSRELDNAARDRVEVGDLSYWPTGRAFCIFFGPTPVSSPGEIRPASAVNIIGRVGGDPSEFKQVPAGTTIKLSRL